MNTGREAIARIRFAFRRGNARCSQCGVDIALCRWLERQSANDVQRCEAGGDFFANPVGTLASQHIGTQRDLDFSEEGLNSPPTGEESDDFFGWITLEIQQGSDKLDDLTPLAHAQNRLEETHLDMRGQRRVLTPIQLINIQPADEVKSLASYRTPRLTVDILSR